MYMFAFSGLSLMRCSTTLVEKRDKTIQWLGSTSEVIQADIIRTQGAHSAQWLLDRAEFLDWLTSESSAKFWLSGIRK